MEGSALAPVPMPGHAWLTPLRAVLLMLGFVLCGLALSLMFRPTAAHAAEGDGDGSGSGQSLLGSVTSVVTATVDAGIPTVQQTVSAAGDSVVATVPAAAPIVAPTVTTVNATLAAVQQAAVPVIRAAVTLDTEATLNLAITAASSPISAAIAPHGSAVSAVEPVGSGAEGMPSGPILTSSSGAPLAALGVLLALFALVLLAARRRLDDDALPASPVFETDTSPA